MSDTVTLTIDGLAVTVPKGTNIVEAARALKIEIPYFCYHPGLSAPAVCRQCLVEIAGQPKLVPACYTPVAEGMKVVSSSEKVRQARRQMLEFTLINHPVDCPICDKAGECNLQRLYFNWDAQPSRISHDKVHKPKRVDIGPSIILDAERCILCTRCIRVCDEVAHEHQLEMANRGNREVISTAPGQALDNPYALNTVDVCPVGALTAKDFRFTMRAWELMTTPSICNGCATGCNIEVHHRDGRIYRLIPRYSEEVNKYWMCDEGRFTHKDVHRDRLITPLVDGQPTTWENALDSATVRLQSILDVARDKVGIVLGPGFSNEDNYALAKLAREYLSLGRFYVAGKRPVPEREDAILRSRDIDPNRQGVRTISEFASENLANELAKKSLRALIVLGADQELADEALLKTLETLIVVSTHERGLAKLAHVAFPAASWAETHGTITNKNGRVQRLRAAFPPPGQALPAWEVVLRLGKRLGAVLEFASAHAIFCELAAKVPGIAPDAFGPEAPLVQLRFAGSRG